MRVLYLVAGFRGAIRNFVIMHTRAAGGKCKGNDEDASKVAVNVRETSDEELGEGRGPKSRRGPEGSPRLPLKLCWRLRLRP